MSCTDSATRPEPAFAQKVLLQAVEACPVRDPVEPGEDGGPVEAVSVAQHAHEDVVEHGHDPAQRGIDEAQQLILVRPPQAREQPARGNPDHIGRAKDDRRRTDPQLLRPPGRTDTTRTDTAARQPDPRPAPDELWEEEWRKNLMDAAIERVKQQVAPKQFQIFDLSVLRDLPVTQVTQLVKVNAAQVYIARHRVGALIKKEVKRLEARAANPGQPPPCRSFAGRAHRSRADQE